MNEYSTKDGRTVIIREATERDLQKIIDVWNRVAAEKIHLLTERVTDFQRRWFQQTLKERAGLWAVSEINEQIVGTCNLMSRGGGRVSKTRHVVELGMAILSEFRGIGIGNAMMEYMVDWARKKGYEKISLSVFSSNKPAINLYKKFGFDIEGVKKKEFKVEGQYVDEVCMGRFL